MKCPRCGRSVRKQTTVAAWDHIVRYHKDWMRDLIALDDADGEADIKNELRAAFRGIDG